MKKIKVSAPGKLMLFGEHAVVYNRPCIVTTVDQRIRVLIELVFGDEIKIDAPEVGVAGYTKKLGLLGQHKNLPKGVQFLETSIKNFFEKYKVKSGLRIETKSEFSSEFGFGSSSAVTVAAFKGLSELFKIKMDNKKLFDLAHKTVLDVQGVGSGFDLAAAIWGGTVFFVTGGKKVIPLKVKKLPLVVGYTGIKADTPTMVKKVAILRENNKKLVDSIFDQISLLTNKAKTLLLRGNFKKTGELMNLNQELLDALGVNTKELSNLIIAARETGAWGAKLSGAGGGDCMIAFIKEEKRKAVESAIQKAGGRVIKVRPNAEGVKIE